MSDIKDDTIKYKTYNLVNMVGSVTGYAVAKIFSKTKSENIPQIRESMNTIIRTTPTLRDNNVQLNDISIFGEAGGYYGINSKTVGVNMKKNPLCGFHELGHAYIENKYPIVNLIPKYKILPISSILAVLSPLIIGLTEKHIKNEKIKDGINISAPYIAGGIWLPTIINEAAATIKGAQLAKPLLNKKLYGRMNTCNIAALSTYIFTASTFFVVTKVMQKLSEVLKEKDYTE